MVQKGVTLQLVLKEVYVPSQALPPRSTARLRLRIDQNSSLTYPLGFAFLMFLTGHPLYLFL